ncbi:MAG: glycoside hydrolase family 95 protein, partial [Bacteroidota bacterium]|nr:glycoside hydrolase family 95 protein [Bacteroidota bacterium]
MNKYVLSVLLLFRCLNSSAQDSLLRLWYDHPAGSVWEAALPMGNGHLGAMVYGNTDSECIKLNESTLWIGGPNRNDNPHALESLSEIRKLIFEGKNEAAAKLASEKVQSEKINGMTYQPAADLHLFFPGHQKPENYYRELDLSRAVQKTRYVVDGVQFIRESFVSMSDRILVIRFTSNSRGSINFNASLSSLQRSLVSLNANNELVLSGISGDHDGVKGIVKFRCILRTRISGGSLSGAGNSVEIRHADSVTLYISIATNFVNYNKLDADEARLAAYYLDNSTDKSYEQLL